MKEDPDARDWSYGIATSISPSDSKRAVAFNADAWSPAPNTTEGDAVRFNFGYVIQWSDIAVLCGLPGHVVVRFHG